MDEEIKLLIGMIGMLIASGLLTWLTQPSQFAPVPSKRKHKTKLRLRDRSPFQNDEDHVVLNPRPDSTTSSPDRL